MPPDPDSVSSASRSCSRPNRHAPQGVAWHYGLRPLSNGEWSVERDGGEAGGVFSNLTAAIRFLRYDLDVLILAHDQADRP
jgi:hypothetical protein